MPALLAPLPGMERMCVNATLDLPWLEQQVASVASGRPRVATLGPFLRLRLWSLGNSIRAAGVLAPFVLALFALLIVDRAG